MLLENVSSWIVKVTALILPQNINNMQLFKYPSRPYCKEQIRLQKIKTQAGVSTHKPLLQVWHHRQYLPQKLNIDARKHQQVRYYSWALFSSMQSRAANNENLNKAYCGGVRWRPRAMRRKAVAIDWFGFDTDFG